MEVNLVGDAAETLRALLPLLKPRKRRHVAQARSKRTRPNGGRRSKSARCSRADPVNPQRVAWELSPRLPDRVIVTSDSGSCANWYARDLKMRRGMMASLSGGLASMGAAVPYAIAAKFAHPDRPGHRAGRRRRHADEQHGRADHRRQILAAVVRSTLDRLRLQQRGPEPGHLGAAGDGGRSEIRRLAADSQCAVSQLRRTDRPQGHLCRPTPTQSAPHGTKRSPPTGRSCSR